MTRIVPFAFSAVLLGTGCATTQYVYRPAVHDNAEAGGVPAAYYELPPGKAQGDVRVVSYGVADVQLHEGGPRVPVIQVRMIVTNNDDPTPWTVDVRDLRLAVGRARHRAILVNTNAGKPPVLTVASGRRYDIDLYYPLPKGVTSASGLPDFDLVWQVKTGSGVIVRRTPFERAQVEGGAYAYEYPYWEVGVGFGPHWWYDSWYPGAYYGGPIVVRPYRFYPRRGFGHRYFFRRGFRRTHAMHEHGQKG